MLNAAVQNYTITLLEIREYQVSQLYIWLHFCCHSHALVFLQQEKEMQRKDTVGLEAFSNNRIGYMELYGNLEMTAYPNSLVRP